jgi:hypothetical protein
MPITLTDAQRIAQQAADLAWACGTCEDRAVAFYQSDVYRAAHAAFRAAVILAYGLADAETDATENLLSEYGPDDSLQGTSGRGVFSYVQAARQNVAEQHAMQAERDTKKAHLPDDQRGADWATYRNGERIHTARLADIQIGAYMRRLGPGYQVCLVPDEPLADWERELLSHTRDF